jgi:hypothetical protein
MGAIFASDTTSPLYFAKKTTDEIELLSNQRLEILNNIVLNLEYLLGQVALIDDSWYSTTYNDDVSNALGDIEVAIPNLLTVKSHLYNKSILHTGELELAKSRVYSSVNYLKKLDTSASIYDLQYYLEELSSDASDLMSIDDNINTYIDNIKNFREEFNNNCVGAKRLTGYAREMVGHQYDQLVSVRDVIRESLKRDNLMMLFSHSKEWVSLLVTIAASMDNLEIDYAEIVNDDTHIDTSMLIQVINNFKLPSRTIDKEIIDMIFEIIAQVKKNMSTKLSISNLLALINTGKSHVDDDIVITENIISDCTTYSPTVVPAVDEIIIYINNLGLDRAKAVLVSSKWSDIFGLFDRNLSFPDIISDTILGFIDTVEDTELRSKILSLYYTIQAQKRTKNILGLTYDSVKKSAIDYLVNKKIKQNDGLMAQLDVISRRLK